MVVYQSGPARRTPPHPRRIFWRELVTDSMSRISRAGSQPPFHHPPAFAEELAFARQLAAQASAVALERCRHLSPREKANRSFVTDLDLDVERLLRDRLAARFPEDALTGEEHDREGGDGPRRWSIDPIDGTGNLVHGLPLWAISIGLLVESPSGDGESAAESESSPPRPVVGVIAIPPLGETFWAVQGGGAWLDDQPLPPLAEWDAESFHPQDNVSLSTNALRRLDPRRVPGRIRDLGAACVELAFLAAGRLRAAVFLGEAEHDLAAGAVLLGEVGASIRRLDAEGTRLTPARLVAETPVRIPTLLGPRGRVDALFERLDPYATT